MIRRVLLLISLLLAMSVQTVAVAAQVEGVRLWQSPDGTRVVLDLDDPVDHRIFSLRDPARVVIDLADTDLGSVKFPDVAGVVSYIRSGKREKNLRIVLDLATESVRPRSVLLPPNEVYGHRVVIDLVTGSDKAPTPVAAIEHKGRDVLIAIDPGHGGEDPGAIGRRGTYEKNVVLEVARRLARLIDAEPGMRAMLTRDNDYFLSHRNRMKKARDHRADFFVSIHADAFKDERASGSSVYALSARGATSEAARWLAARENAADLIGGVSLDDKDDLLASVLLDLSQTAAISASLSAGGSVLEELADVNRIRGKVQQANFLVLKSPDIPSLLIETAFISNPDEERRLRDPGHQEKLAQAIKQGIRNYFADYAPPDTLLSDLRPRQAGPVQQHVIGHGETLSGIAQRYQIAVSALRRANHLNGDSIHAGQVLQVPRVN